MLNSIEHEIIVLINVKMPTIVGILTFISMINTIPESLKARKFFILQHFSFYEELKELGSRRGEIGPAIEMHTDLKHVYMVNFIEKNRNFICLVLKLCKLWVSKDKDPL